VIAMEMEREILSIQLPRDEFHARLGGGLPRGSLVLLEGEHGSGKSAIIQRMAYGLLKNNHSITIISTQLTTRDFIYQMHSLNYPLLSYLRNGSLLFVSAFPLMSETKAREDFIEQLMTTESLFDKEVIFIDSLSSLIKKDITEERILDLLSFFKRLTGIGKVIVISLDAGQLKEEFVEIFRASATLSLAIKRRVIGNDIKHYIMVNKYLLARQSFMNIIGFKVEPKIGFVVEITSVV
jgi:flagellar protein FlaH